MQVLLYVGEGDSREVDEVAGWLPDSTQWLSGMTLYRQRRGLTHQTCCHPPKAATNQYLPVWTSRTLFFKCLKLNPCEALPPLSWRTCQDSIKAHELGTDIFEHTLLIRCSAASVLKNLVGQSTSRSKVDARGWFAVLRWLSVLPWYLSEEMPRKISD